MCHGTRICSFCQGRGFSGIIEYYTIPCSVCHQTGLCNSCKNTGQCFCNKTEYPGYAISSFSHVTPDGQSYNERVDYNNNSSSSRSSSNTGITRHKCTTCNGTGIVDFDTNPPNFTGEDDTFQVYCKTCGKYYPKYRGHTHTTCRFCSGKGYREY